MNNATSLKSAFAEVKQQQQTLVALIFPQSGDRDGNHDFDHRGLAIYRNNLSTTAQQALAITFPTVKAMIGDELFNYACHQLLVLSPPTMGDWGLWGEDFAELLADLPQLVDYPFVADIAKLDWLRHHCMRDKDSILEQESVQLLADLSQLVDYPFVADIAKLDWLRHHCMRDKDSILEQESVQLLATTELDDLYLELSSHHFVLESKFPLIEFWQAHQNNDADKNDKLMSEQHLTMALEKMLNTDFVQQVLIYRPNYNAHVKEISKTEQQWLKELKQGTSIGKALDKLADPTFDFAHWLGEAIAQNLIRRFYI